MQLSKSSSWFNFRILNRLGAIGLLVGASASPLIAAGASAAEAEPTQIFVQNTDLEYVIDVPGEDQKPYLVEVLLSGEVPGQIVVSFLDTLNPDQPKKSFPAGSLPTSLTKVLEQEPMDLTYTPNGKTQTYLLKFNVKPGHQSRAYFGKLRVAFSPGSELEAQSSGTIGVNKNLFVFPHGWLADNLGEDRTPSVIVSNGLVSTTRTSFVDELIPDLPWLINSGPVQANVRVANNGSYPNNTKVEWQFFDGDKLLAKKSIPEEFMLGGSYLDADFQATYTDESIGRAFDVLPGFRLLRCELLVQSELSGVDYQPQKQVSYFVIAPWKEMLFFISLAGAIGAGLRKLIAFSRRSGLKNDELGASTDLSSNKETT